MGARRSIVFAILAGAIGLGCSKEPSLIGTWTSDSTSEQGIHTKSEAVFHSDGRYVATSQVSGPTGGTIIAVDMGTWKLSNNDKLTVVLKDVQWETLGLSAAGEARVRKRLEQNKKAMIDEVNKESPLTIKWKGPDEFSTTSHGITDVHRRKK